MKWEYKVILIPASDIPKTGIIFPAYVDVLELQLNCLGDEGWELAAVLGRYSINSRLVETVFTFKRPLL